MAEDLQNNIQPLYALIWRRILLSVLILLTVIIVGTVGYRLIEKDWTWTDAIYMTVITISTVGFREVHPLSQAGQLFASALIISSIGAVTYAALTLARIVLEQELGNALRGLRMQRKISSLSNHVVVCGYGRSGRQAADELCRDGVQVVAVDNETGKLSGPPPPGVYWLHGDATEEHVLHRAEVEHAQGLIATLPKDADNVFVALCARELNPGLKIVARANDERSVSKLRRAGVHRVILPDTIGGRRMASVLLRPAVMEFVNVLTGGETGGLRLEEFAVTESSSLVGKTLRDWSVRQRTGANIVGIKRGRGPVMLNPAADTTLSAGDILIALGHDEQLKKLAEWR